MTPSRGWVVLSAGCLIALAAGCSRHSDGDQAQGKHASTETESAEAFVARANKLLEKDAITTGLAHSAAANAASDTALKPLVEAEARHLTLLDGLMDASTSFDGRPLQPQTERAIERLRLFNATPIPHDPARIAELATLIVRLRTAPTPLRNDYARFVALTNDGARRLGFANAGEYQRARHDMDADAWQAQANRLWSEIKPLYDQLQCFARRRLQHRYGDRAQHDGLIRAQLTDGPGPAEWTRQMDLLTPFPVETDANAATATTGAWSATVAAPATGRQPFLLRPRNDDPLAIALAQLEAMRPTTVAGNVANPAQSANDPQATINAQMRSALDVFSRLAFVMAADRWRWGVADGSIKPADYNKAWWALRAKYEGIAPPTPTDERTFDPGMAPAIAENQPLGGAFLGSILVFQLDRALCRSTATLYGCDFEHDAAAGKRYRAMRDAGASQPWQRTLAQFTSNGSPDTSALLEYFAPLREWLQQQNTGKPCGWEGNFSSMPPSSQGSQ